MSKNWFVDRSDEYGEGGHESPADALAERCLGDTIQLEEWSVVDLAIWQLVPVEEDGKPCRCGKPQGCGDFLGVDCHADREQPIKLDELPEKWRTL